MNSFKDLLKDFYCPDKKALTESLLKNPTTLVRFLSENIGAFDLITTQELADYQKLVKSGFASSEVELDDVSVYGILDCQEEIKLLEEELFDLQAKEKVLDNTIKDLQNTKESVISEQQIKKLTVEELLIDGQYEIDSVTHHLEEVHEERKSLLQLIQERASEIANYMPNVVNPIYYSQVPLNDYENECSNFDNLLKFYIDKQFNNPLHSDVGSRKLSIFSDSLGNNLNAKNQQALQEEVEMLELCGPKLILEEKIASIQKVVMQSSLVEINEIWEEIKTGNITYKELMRQLQDLEKETKTDPIEEAMPELLKLSESEMALDITKHTLLELRCKVERYKYWNEKMKNLKSELQKQFKLRSLMKGILKQEEKEFKLFIKFLEWYLCNLNTEVSKMATRLEKLSQTADSSDTNVQLFSLINRLFRREFCNSDSTQISGLNSQLKLKGKSLMSFTTEQSSLKYQNSSLISSALIKKEHNSFTCFTEDPCTREDFYFRSNQKNNCNQIWLLVKNVESIRNHCMNYDYVITENANIWKNTMELNMVHIHHLTQLICFLKSRGLVSFKTKTDEDNIQKQVAEYRERMSELKEDFQQKVTLLNNPITQNHRLLWVYFLKDPDYLKKIFTDMDSILQNMASQFVKLG